MTDDEARALGLRARAAGFEPTEGCLVRSRPYDRNAVDPRAWTPHRVSAAIPAAAGAWPDLRDDATRGVLLGQVISAMNADPRQPLQFDTWADLAADLGSLEPEALVAALERGQG